MDNWKVVEQKIALDHPWVRLLIETLERGNERRPYFYLESPTDAVAVVAVDNAGQVVLTRQYRHPLRAVIYDLPGGRADKSEVPIEAARRELVEETGYIPDHIEALGTLNPFPGSLRVSLYLFFASGLQPGPSRPDEGEELEVHLRPFEEVYQGVLHGEYIDGALQTGLLLARARGLA